MYAGLAVAARHERQPLEADHRVAAPVGEPVIAGDDGADLLARRTRPRRFVGASGRRDDELVGRKHQLRGEAILVRRCGAIDQTAAPAGLGTSRLLGRERLHHVPGLRRRHEGHRPRGCEIRPEIPRTPQRADEFVPANLLHPVRNVRTLGVERQRPPLAVQHQSQDGQVGRGAHLVPLLHRGHRECPPGRRVDGGLVGSEVQRRPQREPDRALPSRSR